MAKGAAVHIWDEGSMTISGLHCHILERLQMCRSFTGLPPSSSSPPFWASGTSPSTSCGQHLITACCAKHSRSSRTALHMHHRHPAHTAAVLPAVRSGSRRCWRENNSCYLSCPLRTAASLLRLLRSCEHWLNAQCGSLRKITDIPFCSQVHFLMASASRSSVGQC